jgi:hypothetical protein
MKKLILLVVFAAFGLSSSAQRNNNEWFLNVGLNAINSLGTQSPFNSPDDWAFRFPISAAIEFNWGKNEYFSIEQSITLNGFNDDSRIDFAALENDLNYISLDTHLKYYFGQKYLFPRNERLDLYLNGGIGFFHIDETNISANFGGGVLFWFNNKKRFGLRAQIIGKFAFNHPESGFDNNHYQYHLQAVFRL